MMQTMSSVVSWFQKKLDEANLVTLFTRENLVNEVVLNFLIFVTFAFFIANILLNVIRLG